MGCICSKVINVFILLGKKIKTECWLRIIPLSRAFVFAKLLVPKEKKQVPFKKETNLMSV